MHILLRKRKQFSFPLQTSAMEVTYQLPLNNYFQKTQIFLICSLSMLLPNSFPTQLGCIRNTLSVMPSREPQYNISLVCRCAMRHFICKSYLRASALFGLQYTLIYCSICGCRVNPFISGALEITFSYQNLWRAGSPLTVTTYRCSNMLWSSLIRRTAAYTWCPLSPDNTHSQGAPDTHTQTHTHTLTLTLTHTKSHSGQLTATT